MNVFSTELDDCRRWIKKKREKNISWEELKLACKKDENGLSSFLKMRKEEDEWPEELDNNLWKELVSNMEDADERRIENYKAAEIHDKNSKELDLNIPDNPKSSWQLYREYLLETKHFSEDSVNKIEDSSINILKRLSLDTQETGPVKGMVIGNVQSGKTANMAALMAMAADWGFNMFIVLSGTIESLRKQTQHRIFNDLNNHYGNLYWNSLEHLSKKSSIGYRLSDLRLEKGSKQKYLTVCLKNKNRLTDLIQWIEQDKNQIQNLRVLVIDDEADQAGINTGDVFSDEERSAISNLVINLVYCRDEKAVNSETNTFNGHYQAMNYIGYTATPYANFLNENGPDTLYPCNFIRTLDLPDSYFGPDRYFETDLYSENTEKETENSRQLDVIRIISAEDEVKIKTLQKKGSGELPSSLKDAVCWFICMAAAMRYYDYKKPVSMLIHTSQKKNDHKIIADTLKSWLENDLDQILIRCRKIYSEESKRFTLESFVDHYPEYEYPIEEVWDYPIYENIEVYIKELLGDINSIMMNKEGDLKYIRGIHICIDDSANNGIDEEGKHIRLAYPEDNSENKPDFASAFIVIGGNTLSRGLTLEGLVSTFFLRTVKQMDTLMQMGRWFGYRRHYELFPRIWMTEDTEEKFELLTDVDNDLRDQIYRMEIAGMEPDDFNLALMSSPKVTWLRLTAKNRMQMAEKTEYDFSGMDMQLTVYSKDSAVQKKNISVTYNFIKNMGPGYRISSNSPDYIWENISYEDINEFFSNGFQVCDTSRSFQQMNVLNDWIERQTEDKKLLKWNVILCGTKITDEIPDKRIWEPAFGIKIGKIERSCKSESMDQINIGVLSNKKDYLADIKEDEVEPKTWNEMKIQAKASKNYYEYRKKAGRDKIPLFLIYIIAKDSKASRNGRKPLNLENDLIGISMVIPGIRGTNKAVTRYKITGISDNKEYIE